MKSEFRIQMDYNENYERIDRFIPQNRLLNRRGQTCLQHDVDVRGGEDHANHNPKHATAIAQTSLSHVKLSFVSYCKAAIVVKHYCLALANIFMGSVVAQRFCGPT
jgi:hypothetical protein